MRFLLHKPSVFNHLELAHRVLFFRRASKEAEKDQNQGDYHDTES